jgi:hypothetical protein
MVFAHILAPKEVVEQMIESCGTGDNISGQPANRIHFREKRRVSPGFSNIIKIPSDESKRRTFLWGF